MSKFSKFAFVSVAMVTLTILNAASPRSSQQSLVPGAVPEDQETYTVLAGDDDFTAIIHHSPSNTEFGVAQSSFFRYGDMIKSDGNFNGLAFSLETNPLYSWIFSIKQLKCTKCEIRVMAARVWGVAFDGDLSKVEQLRIFAPSVWYMPVRENVGGNLVVESARALTLEGKGFQEVDVKAESVLIGSIQSLSGDTKIQTKELYFQSNAQIVAEAGRIILEADTMPRWRGEGDGPALKAKSIEIRSQDFPNFPPATTFTVEDPANNLKFLLPSTAVVPENFQIFVNGESVPFSDYRAELTE